LIQAGKVRALGITGTQSLKQLPDVKPIKVKGVPINSYAAWAIALPPGTPEEVTSWYRDAFVKALKSPEAAKFRDDNLIVLDEKELSSSGLKATLDGLRSIWLPFAQKVNLTGQ
jgi:tripartite-type tricarboxylate transporter receptor subunit TctC